MSDQPSHKIDWLRTAAGALAAVASAVLLSTLGAAGTLIGAAVGSVVISIATNLFSSGLARGRQRVADVQEAAMRHVGVAQAEIRRANRRTEESEAHLEHADDMLAQAKQELTEEPAPSFRDRLAAVSWPRAAAYAAGLFAVVVVAITGFELLTGQRPGHHPQRHGVDFNAFDAHQSGRIQQQLTEDGVIQGALALLAQHLADPAEVDAGRDRDVHHGARPVLGLVDRLDDLAVRNGHHLAIRGTQPGHPQRHVLYRAAGFGR